MNRKNEPIASRFGPGIKLAILSVFVCGLGLGYVWQKQEISQLGKNIHDQEKRLDGLRRENRLRSDMLDQLRSPRSLDQRVKEMNLGLTVPRPEQVVVIVEGVNGTKPNTPMVTAQRKVR